MDPCGRAMGPVEDMQEILEMKTGSDLTIALRAVLRHVGKEWRP